MTEAAVASIAQEAIITAFLVGAPILAVSLVIGLTISILQAVTQVNEVTLTFVPKILGVFAVSALQGLSQREIAEVLDMPLGTIKGRMARAAAEVRRKLLRYVDA